MMHKAVTITTCPKVRKFLAEQWIQSAWSVNLDSSENQLNCCEVRNEKDDDDDDNNNNNNNNNILIPA